VTDNLGNQNSTTKPVSAAPANRLNGHRYLLQPTIYVGQR
jgi:hypothetical protein